MESDDSDSCPALVGRPRKVVKRVEKKEKTTRIVSCIARSKAIRRGNIRKTTLAALIHQNRKLKLKLAGKADISEED